MHCNRILHGATTYTLNLRSARICSYPVIIIFFSINLFTTGSNNHMMTCGAGCGLLRRRIWFYFTKKINIGWMHTGISHPPQTQHTQHLQCQSTTLLLTLTTTLDTVSTTTFITSGDHLLQAIRFYSALPTFNSYIWSFFSLWVIKACQLMIFINKPLSHIFFRYDILNHYMQLQHLLGINGLDSPSVSAPTLSSPPLCH